MTEDDNEHDEHAVAVVCYVRINFVGGASNGRPGVNSRPGLYQLLDSVYTRRLNEAGLYSEEASIRGNTVYACTVGCYEFAGSQLCVWLKVRLLFCLFTWSFVDPLVQWQCVLCINTFVYLSVIPPIFRCEQLHCV